MPVRSSPKLIQITLFPGLPDNMHCPRRQPLPEDYVSIRSNASSRPLTAWLSGGALLMLAGSLAHAQRFSIDQIMSAPFAASLVAAPDAQAFAWSSNRAGHRNIWVAQAQGGTFKSRAATHYAADDGLELSELAFVPHAHQLLCVRGGGVEYPDKPPPNPGEVQPGVTQENRRVR